ncbi:MAG: serine hydrolase [Cyanobacteria bacterium P01_F01_bin.86]
MTENRNSSNDSHSPFRRYVPPASNTNGSNNGQVMPFPQASKSPPPNRPTRSSETPQRNRSDRSRSDRSRWRRWVNVTPIAKIAPSPVPPTEQRRSVPPPSRQAPIAQPQSPAHTQHSAEAIRPPLNRPPLKTLPKNNRQSLTSIHSVHASQPPRGSSAPSAFVRHPSGPTPQAGPTPQGHASQVSLSARTDTNPSVRGTAPGLSTPMRPPTSGKNPVSKVTPLRRRPVWSTPADTDTTKGPPPRERRSARPRGRKAPRPILYGIRLLILGTGIAAIAGTVLSTLNSGKEASVSNPNTNRVAEASPGQWGLRNQAGSALTQPLNLAEELIHLETDLVGLGALTPGLAQSVFLYDLDTGNYVDLEGTRALSSASTIKVPVLVAFLEAVDAGTLRLDQAVTLQEELIGGGSGEMQTHQLGSRYTALDVATEMIVNSDNTATNMMINLLGGRELLNRRFQAWGLKSTILRNSLPDLEGTNTTSPADLVRLMTLVDRGELLDVRSRDRLFNIMQRTYNRTLIPDGLGDPSAIAFNKTGDIGTALGDVALIDVANGKRYVLSIIVDRPHNDGRASELIRRVAGRVHEEMKQPVTPIGGTAPATTPPSEASQPGETLPNEGVVEPDYSGNNFYENPGAPRE